MINQLEQLIYLVLLFKLEFIINEIQDLIKLKLKVILGGNDLDEVFEVVFKVIMLLFVLSSINIWIGDRKLDQRKSRVILQYLESGIILD